VLNVLLYLMSFVVLFHENEVYARFLWQILSALKITGMCFMKTKFTHGFCQIFVKDFLFSTAVIFYLTVFTGFVVLFHENEVYARFLWQILSALKITGMCFMKTKFTHGFCQIFVKAAT